MATVTLTSACNTSFPLNFNFENDMNHLCDTFSPHPGNGEEKKSVLSAAGHVMEPFYQKSLGRKYNQDGEISVFNAEKYFSCSRGMVVERKAMAEIGSKRVSKKEEVIDLLQPKTSTKSGTPSTCGEASWNNQSALLQGLQKNPPPDLKRLVSIKRLLGSFGCNCYCSGKKSVDVDEKIEKNRDPITETARNLSGLGEKKQNRPEYHLREEMDKVSITVGGSKKEDSFFAFPNSNPVGNLTVGRQVEKARVSFEVFGSTFSEKNNGPSLQSKLNMLTLDTSDDLESESSSDLFEIDNLSWKGASDDMSSCAATTTYCYEPSELSVITASAANRSVASDYYEGPNRMIMTTMTTTKTGVVKEAQRRQPSLFSGCTSGKAVTVASNAYTICEKPKPEQSKRL